MLESFCFALTHDHSSPYEITQDQALVSTIFNVYSDSDAVISVYYIFHYVYMLIIHIGTKKFINTSAPKQA